MKERILYLNKNFNGECAMKKILYFIILLVFSMGLTGCSKDPFETAENYNQFTRTYMFSVADSNVTSRIEAERSAR